MNSGEIHEQMRKDIGFPHYFCSLKIIHHRTQKYLFFQNRKNN
jgi:hypothetical protein